MYCKTLNNTAYSYLHQKGNPKFFKKSFKNLMGSVGLIYDEETIDDKTYSINNKDVIIKAFKWLKLNNTLFDKYLCNYEKIISYLVSLTPDSLHMGKPKLLYEHLDKIQVINNEGNFKESGILININIENNVLPKETDDIMVGVVIKKRKIYHAQEFTYSQEKIKYDDKDTYICSLISLWYRYLVF
jgi:hypothetical protein